MQEIVVILRGTETINGWNGSELLLNRGGTEHRSVCWAVAGGRENVFQN